VNRKDTESRSTAKPQPNCAKRLECVELAPAFHLPHALRKRQQVGRTPYASRHAMPGHFPVLRSSAERQGRNRMEDCQNHRRTELCGTITRWGRRVMAPGLHPMQGHDLVGRVPLPGRDWPGHAEDCWYESPEYDSVGLWRWHKDSSQLAIKSFYGRAEAYFSLRSSASSAFLRSSSFQGFSILTSNRID